MKKLLLVLAFVLASPLLASTKTVTFDVKGWTCGSCAAATRIALKKLDGVEEVKTDHGNREAKVTYDDSKVTSEQVVQSIEKLGYKASFKGDASCATDTRPAEKTATASTTSLGRSADQVSFYEVPLACCAADGLGCGSLAKPILKELEQDSKIAEARINYPGTILAVVWKDSRNSSDSLVEAAFKKHDLEMKALRGGSREKSLGEFNTERWYSAADVDRLSEREAEVIATRFVARTGTRLQISSERRDALTRDLTAAVARHLTGESEEDCEEEDHRLELTKVASKHLNPEQLKELQKAAEQGIEALPGEVK